MSLISVISEYFVVFYLCLGRILCNELVTRSCDFLYTVIYMDATSAQVPSHTNNIRDWCGFSNNFIWKLTYIFKKIKLSINSCVICFYVTCVCQCQCPGCQIMTSDDSLTWFRTPRYRKPHKVAARYMRLYPTVTYVTL